MKKLILLIALISYTGMAQTEYAHWSLEMGLGTNRMFSSIDESKPDININVSGRYMFNRTLGIMTTLSYDKYRSSHPECEYLFNSYKYSVEGVLTLARLNNFTLLGSGGFGGSYYQLEYNRKERVFNSTAAATLLYRLSNWGAVKGVLRTTAIHNLDKSFDLSFDPNTILTQAQSFTGSIGFSVYLDNTRNKPLHYDWYVKEPIKTIETRYEVQKLPIVNYVENCDNCDIKEWRYTLFFKEGEDCFSTENNANNQQLESAMFKVKTLENPKVFVNSFRCGGNGTPESNEKLAKDSFNCFSDYWTNETDIKPILLEYGIDPIYKDMGLNKRIEIIILK